MSGFKIISHKEKLDMALRQQIANALEICGGKAESYAKQKCPVDTGTLRNSISHSVDEDNCEGYVGTNMEYAPYVEFGTGIFYAGGRRTPWTYIDAKGVGHQTRGNPPTHFLQKSVEEHVREYENIIKTELKK